MYVNKKVNPLHSFRIFLKRSIVLIVLNCGYFQKKEVYLQKRCVQSVTSRVITHFLKCFNVHADSARIAFLLSSFIYELAIEIEESCPREIQLHPDVDLTLLFLLLFAEDIILISDTIGGLRKRMNILEKYCIDYQLDVNSDKTKVYNELKNGFTKGRNLSVYTFTNT